MNGRGWVERERGMAGKKSGGFVRGERKMGERRE